MENFLLSLVFGVIGAVLGSFSVAQVWRLRAKQLQEERESGKKVDSNEWKKLHSLVSVKAKNDRSHCLNCGYQLKWFDLIPIISWLSLSGKCRKCRSKIGSLEFFSEILMFVLFAIIFLIFNPISNGTILVLPAIRLILLLISLVPLAIMFIYDTKWSLLPTKLLYVFNILAFVYWATGFLTVSGGFNLKSIFYLAISMMFFPLIYFVLAKVSKEQWVGGGDWILAVGLILLLPNHPVFAIFLLFISNVIGLVFAVFQSILHFRKVKRGTQIPFGPAMILASLTLLAFQQQILIFFINLIM